MLDASPTAVVTRLFELPGSRLECLHGYCVAAREGG